MIINLENKDTFNSYDSWQTWIAMGINVALISRHEQLTAASNLLNMDFLKKMELQDIMRKASCFIRLMIMSAVY